MPGHHHELSCFFQLVTWQCHVVVVSMHGGGGWQSNSGCRRVAIVVHSCSFVITIMYRRWLDDVAHPDGPLMCHIVAKVGTCGAAGVVVYCGWLGLFTGWVVFVVHRIL